MHRDELDIEVVDLDFDLESDLIRLSLFKRNRFDPSLISCHRRGIIYA